MKRITPYRNSAWSRDQGMPYHVVTISRRAERAHSGIGSSRD
jgi:hypothetical protein